MCNRRLSLGVPISVTFIASGKLSGKQKMLWKMPSVDNSSYTYYRTFAKSSRLPKVPLPWIAAPRLPRQSSRTATISPKMLWVDGDHDHDDWVYCNILQHMLSPVKL